MTEAQATEIVQLLTWLLQLGNLLLVLLGAVAFGVIAHLFMEAVGQ